MKKGIQEQIKIINIRKAKKQESRKAGNEIFFKENADVLYQSKVTDI
jgi:hypothetical protein